MKGSLHTDELLSEVVKRDTGIRTGRRISHVFVMDVPGHPHTLFITDSAVNIAHFASSRAASVVQKAGVSGSLQGRALQRLQGPHRC
jgi:phosphate acetyltransferase